MNRLVTNVVKKPYELRVTYDDGRTEIVTIEAESLSAAFLLLPDDAIVAEPIGENMM